MAISTDEQTTRTTDDETTDRADEVRTDPLGPAAGPLPGADEARARLSTVLVADDPSDGLWDAVRDGFFDVWIPEIPAMAMEQDPIHRHKDVLAHTIAVTANTPPALRVRLAALLHDIGKPATRRIGPDGVTFRHHEVVGARIVEQRLDALGFDDTTVADIARLVALSGRFKGYADGWTDSAVRRYARDAGHLLGELNTLVRCDCTTRNPRKVRALHDQLDDLEARIRDLAASDARRRRRPPLSGDRIMQMLGLEPGPLVGEAMALQARAIDERGGLDEAEAIALVERWWADRRQG